MQKRHGIRQEFNGPYNFSLSVGKAGDDVWPPAPRRGEPTQTFRGGIAAIPRFTFRFFLSRFAVYTVGFGAMYGSGFGMIYGSCCGFGLLGFILGAIYGAQIGGILGLILGLINGFALGTRAAFLIRRGVPAENAAKNVWVLTPAASAVNGALIAVSLTGSRQNSASIVFIGLIWLIAIIASGHAASIFTKKFAQEYE
jgi:hypothetical protein